MVNPHYQAFIELGMKLADDKRLPWDIPLCGDGTAQDKIGWNLTACTGDVPPPTHYLRDFGPDPKALAILNAERISENQGPAILNLLSVGWQNLIKAAVAEQLFVKRNTPGHVYNNIVRPLRVIGTCSSNEPWQITLDTLVTAIRIAKKIQASGKLGDL